MKQFKKAHRHSSGGRGSSQQAALHRKIWGALGECAHPVFDSARHWEVWKGTRRDSDAGREGV